MLDEAKATVAAEGAHPTHVVVLVVLEQGIHLLGPIVRSLCRGKPLLYTWDQHSGVHVLHLEPNSGKEGKHLTEGHCSRVRGIAQNLDLILVGAARGVFADHEVFNGDMATRPAQGVVTLTRRRRLLISRHIDMTLLSSP